jgi:hypothetical protein
MVAPVPETVDGPLYYKLHFQHEENYYRSNTAICSEYCYVIKCKSQVCVKTFVYPRGYHLYNQPWDGFLFEQKDSFININIVSSQNSLARIHPHPPYTHALSLSLSHTHTHTRLCVCVCVCVCVYIYIYILSEPRGSAWFIKRRGGFGLDIGCISHIHRLKFLITIYRGPLTNSQLQSK